MKKRIVNIQSSHPKAILWYNLGLQLNVSTDIADQISYGYGRLSVYGFWEYPLYFKGGN